MPHKEQQGLNWRNDPILFDSPPLPSDRWLTANDLIEKGQTAELFLWKDCLNLYLIMIRKIDFLEGERLLQSMPYIVLTDYWAKKLRECSLALAERCFYYFAGSPAEYTIRTWQRKIIDYTENQKRIPFPIFRLVDDWHQLFKGNGNKITFQSARGEQFKLPLLLSEEIAYLTGVIDGDGHLDEKQITIVDSSKEYIQLLQQLFQKHFGIKSDRFHRRVIGEQGHTLLFNGKWIVRFFNFLSGHKISGKKYDSLREPLLFKGKPQLRRAYWTGLMDADGSYKNSISFSSSAEQLRKDFCTFLSDYEIEFYEHEFWGEGAKSFVITIPASFRNQFAKLIQPIHPQKKDEFEELLQRKIIAKRSRFKRQKRSWASQVIAFNAEKLINGFFDFSKLPDLCVVGTGKLLKKLRDNRTQAELAEQTSILRPVLSKYETNNQPIPIFDLKKILQLNLQEKHQLMEVLATHQLYFFSKNRSMARLDLQPNDTLLSLLKGLQLREGGYFLIIGFPEQDLWEYQQQLVSYFKIPIKPNAQRFYNSVLETYIREFMIFTD